MIFVFGDQKLNVAKTLIGPTLQLFFEMQNINHQP
jgi:hypothetical protein